MIQKKMTDFKISKEDLDKVVEIKLNSNNYPFLLKHIKNPPKVLYAKGNIDLLNKPAAAIVGTRKPSDKGKIFANKVSKRYGNMGFNIVSGLAFGIDTIAMTNALLTKVPVIGVIPSPLDNIVPKRNRSLADKILKNGGLLISEYPKGTKVYKSNYINRNRIISGISSLTIIVETMAKGGTIHTLKFAKEQIKPIIVADLPTEGNQILKEEGFPIIQIK